MTVSTVHVRLLGAFDVTVDGATYDAFPTRRSAELVQMLALAPGHRLLRDQVIEALWPDLDATAGGANLRKAAHHARRALGHERAVRLRQPHVELFPDASVSTDVEEFVRSATALTAGDVAAAREAEHRYAGELLPGARYEPWAEQQRRVLEALHRDVLRHAQRWDRLLEIDPLNEEAAREVMLAELDAGRRHRSIAVYGRLRSALAHELGVSPQPATHTVYLRTIEDLVPATAPLIGRDRETAVIESLVRRDAGGALVLVRGSAGIGLSTFVSAVAAGAPEWGGLGVLITADAPDDVFATLTAVVEEVLRLAPAAVDRLSDRTRAILTRLTLVSTSGDGPEVQVTRHQMVGAIRRLLEAAGDRLVVVVDDAHRADESSLGVLAQLTERTETGPVVVFAYRTDAAATGPLRAIARAGTRAPVAIDLGPLDHDELGALAQSLGAPNDDRSIDTLAEASQGNAMFAVELCRTGYLGRGLPGELAGSVVDMIGRRFLDLDEEIVAWLRRLSLVTGPLDLATIVALTGCTDDDLTRLLDVALAGDVLVVDEGRYRFRHDLVRRALADRLPPHHAVAVHRDAARRLAELGAAPGTVAHHWLAGHRPDRAVEWLLRAADSAIALGGFPAAVQYLDQIIDHDADHADALRRRAAALDAMGDPRAIAAYDEAVRVATAEEVHELRPLQALAMVKLGDPEGGMRVVAGAEPTRLDSQLAKALAYCGAGLMGHADPQVGALLAAHGRQQALRAGDPSAIVVASWAQAGAAHAQGELRTSLHTDLHDTLALPRLAVSVFDGQLCITQRLLYGSRPYPDVIRWAVAFEQEAARLGAKRGQAFATTLRGEAELLSGRLDDADRHLRAGRQMHLDMGAATGEAFSLQRLAELAAARGDRRAANRLLDESLAVARESDVGFHLFDRIYGARIALAESPADALAAVDAAEALVCGPLETCPGCRITLAVPAAIALAKAGELDRLAAYESSCEWLADVVMQLPAWYAALDEVRGHRCVAEGDRASARTHFTDAVRGFREAGQPDDVARCERELARLG